MPAQSIAYRAYWNLGSGFVPFPGLLGFDVDISAASGPNGLGWGTDVTPGASIRATDTTYATNWRYVPWYGELSRNGGPWLRTFSGVLYERDDDGETLRYDARGIHELIKVAPVRTKVRPRTPIATATSPTSVEDPDSPAYRGGLANEIFWRAGGRPYDQRGIYTSALFYYRCDASAVAPAYPWVDGTNAWEELLALAEAGGGQIYQDGMGVVGYVSPLKLAENPGGTPPHFTNSVYGNLSVTETVEGAYNVVRSNFTRRVAGQQQEIVKDATPREIPPGGSIPVTLAIQWAILRYAAITVVAARPSGEPVAVTVTTVEQTAQQITIQIANPLATTPIRIAAIAVEGDPVIAAGQGVATASTAPFTGTGRDVELRLNDSDLIQTQPDALRRCRMSLAFYAVPRPIYTAADCPLDPTWYVGQYCLLSNTRRGIASVPARIVGLDIPDSGDRVNVRLVRLDGVPKLSDFFVVGRTYTPSTVKRVGW